MNENVIRVHAFFTGRVQGVFFRANTRNKAQELGLSGWVRNLNDGRVEAVFEGPEEKINTIIAWCRHSMPMAEVISVVQHREELQHIHRFAIKR